MRKINAPGFFERLTGARIMGDEESEQVAIRDEDEEVQPEGEEPGDDEEYIEEATEEEESDVEEDYNDEVKEGDEVDFLYFMGGGTN